MSATYEPGIVADVRRGTSDWHRAIFTDDEEWHCIHGLCSPNVTDVRPLVVLDPEDAEQVVRLILALDVEFDGAPRSDLDAADVRNAQEALRSLTRPPKPAEPTGLGAVVEDAEGVLWVRNPDADVHCKWRNRAQQWRNFAAIDAVRVLSEGVTL